MAISRTPSPGGDVICHEPLLFSPSVPILVLSVLGCQVQPFIPHFGLRGRLTVTNPSDILRMLDCLPEAVRVTVVYIVLLLVDSIGFMEQPELVLVH